MELKVNKRRTFAASIKKVANKNTAQLQSLICDSMKLATELRDPQKK